MCFTCRNHYLATDLLGWVELSWGWGLLWERLPFEAVLYEKPWGEGLGFGSLNHLNFLWMVFCFLVSLVLHGN